MVLGGDRRSTADLRAERFADLTVDELYAILRLRTDVFVVEQTCPYPELDGRDTETDTVHLWLRDGDTVVACARLLTEPEGCRRIGRVATLASRRGHGLAGRLVTAALELAGDVDVLLNAQVQLVGFYGQYGFVVDGECHVEDGIVHRPMRRPSGEGRPSGR